VGILDAIVGQVAGKAAGAMLGGALGGGGAQNPLGSIVASLTGGNPSQGGALLSAAMGLLQKGGGLGGVLSKLQQSGLGKEANSWVATGPNAEISGDQLTKAFGAVDLGEIASKLGMQPAQASSAMAKVLPELVNQMTPEGKVPDNHGDLLSQGLEMLKKLGVG
jgi:uncharacterized protein YidB (DUF937 family)